MNSVRDIVYAIRALPSPDRLKLAEALSQELESEKGPPGAGVRLAAPLNIGPPSTLAHTRSPRRGRAFGRLVLARSAAPRARVHS